MKLRESFRYPHPVLNESASDYTQDQIDLTISVEEQPPDSALKIKYDFRIDSPTLQAELKSGTSRSYLSVVCLDAFYNEFIPIEGLIGEVSIPGGKLFGRVDVRGVVVRVKGGVFEAMGLQSDYESAKFDLSPGAVLGWTLPQRFSVGMEKLAPMESIFKLALDDSLDAGTFNVAFDDEYITIRAPHQLLETIHAMRNKPKARPVVLNGVYVPALMGVLQAMKESDAFSDHRWYRVLTGKAQTLGIDLANGNPLKDVQKLMKAPAARLTAFMENFS